MSPGFIRHEDRCIVDEYVDTPKALKGIVDHPLHLGFGRNIRLDEHSLTTELLDCFNRGLPAGRGNLHHYDPGTFLSEARGNRFSDTRPTTGHNRHFVLQAH